MRDYYWGSNPFTLILLFVLVSGSMFILLQTGAFDRHRTNSMFETNKQFIGYADKLTEENMESRGIISGLKVSLNETIAENVRLVERNKFLEEAKAPVSEPADLDLVFLIVYGAIGFVLGRQSIGVKSSEKPKKEDSE